MLLDPCVPITVSDSLSARALVDASLHPIAVKEIKRKAKATVPGVGKYTGNLNKKGRGAT